jgi:hypothetical protein
MLGTSFNRSLTVLACTALLAAAAGCGSLGPKTLDKDQLDYGASIGNNWKNQMLANIVKLRFVDMPVFVDVGSIVAGYSLETMVNGRLGFSDSFTGGDTQGLSATGRYTDRPTITYMPKTGDDYLRSLLAPVEPKNLLALVQAGYNAELLFTWAVEAVNGVHNYSGTASENLVADPEFYELTRLLREMQRLGAAAWEFEKDPESGHDILLVLRKDDISESTLAKRKRIAEIIGLDPGLDKYRVIYAPMHVSPQTLAMQTRSVLQTLAAMARFVDVPAEFTGEAAPGVTVGTGLERPFHVRSSKSKPDESFAAVKYRDYWYWIENSDMASKRVFTLMLFLTTLTSSGGDAAGPVLTIPTG